MNLNQTMNDYTSEDTNFIEVYCKIAYSEINDIFNVPKNLTISNFINYANSTIRNRFHIHSSYDIEVIEIGDHTYNCPNELIPKMEENHNQTMYEKYGHLYNRNCLMAFYIRPVNPVTREFIRRENYHN